MQNNTRKKLIKYLLGICLLVIIILGILITSGQINKIASKEKSNLKAEVQQQTSVPEGYTGIYTADDLKNIANDLTANYILMANINMSGIDWTPLGLNNTAAFTGIFDGNLYKISNLNIESENQYVGLFGYVNGGTIKNLTIENLTVKNNFTTNYQYTGGLVGYIYTGTIENIKTTGTNTITSELATNYYKYIGGLTGYASTGTTINNISTNVNITLTAATRNIYVGGILGYGNSATIENSNSSGKISLTTSSTIYSGGLIGQGNSTTINNSNSTGEITVTTTSYASIGGLTGYNTGAITNTYSTANVIVTTTSYNYTGGLIGHNTGTLTNVYSTGDISATSTTSYTYRGGLVGNNSGNITKAFSTGNISATSTTTYTYTGGLIGNNSGEIKNAYATGKLSVNTTTGESRVGGLIGYSTGVTSDVFSTSTIEGNIEKGTAGGLIGNLYNASNLTNGYAVGKINVTGTSVITGGLVASKNSNNSVNSYWSPETTNQDESVTGTSKLFKSMLYKETFTDWDFDTVWTIEEGNTLPYLLNMNKPESVKKSGYTYLEYEGDGTEENPYLIKTPEQLQGMKNDLSGFYKLANNIVFDSNNNFNIIGLNNSLAFTGGLDGNNYKVSNLNIESDNQYVGIFGYVNGAEIKNLIIENINIKSNTSTGNPNTGALVGYLYTGTIDNVKIIGNSKIENNNPTTANRYVGGLIGFTYSNVIINNSSSNVNIIENITTSSSAYIGGLIGYTYSDVIIYSCSSTIDIEVSSISTTYIGGLVGAINASATISSSYSTGIINIESTNNIYAGGLIGSGYKTNITNSYSKVDIGVISQKHIYAGGLMGNMNQGSLTSSYSNGNITTKSPNYEYVGGLIGYVQNGNSNVNINKVYASSNIKIESAEETQYTKYIGGLMGYVYNSSSSKNYNVNINQAYSTGNIDSNIISTAETNNVYIGGLIGYTNVARTSGSCYNNNINIDETYSTVKISALNGDLGGILAYAGSSSYTYSSSSQTYYSKTNVTNSYWSPEATNQDNSKGGTPKLLQSMLYKETFTDWDFDTAWTIEEGKTLPYFKDLEKNNGVNKTEYTYLEYEGDGTEENPYLIKTPEQLQAMKNDLEKHYKLANDIEWDSSKVFETIGNASYIFTGSLDGNNYKISNLNIESESAMVGLFGRVNGGTIKNLILENETVTNINPSNNGNARTAGLIGYVDTATIENVKITGESIIEDNSLSSYNNIGGLVGYVYSNITIRNSNVEAKIKVNGNSNIYVGGLVGQIYTAGTIDSSYSTGEIIAETTSNLYVGGLVGSSTKANITNSYSSSKITATATNTIYAGGIAGSSTYGTMENTYYKGNITASNGGTAIGGLIGYMVHGSLYSSYNMGDIITNTTKGESVEEL